MSFFLLFDDTATQTENFAEITTVIFHFMAKTSKNNNSLILKFEHTMNGRMFIALSILSILINELLFNRWPMDPQTVNAMYSFNENGMSKLV